MQTIIATHHVQDYDTWKAGFLADEPRRAEMGVTGHVIGRITGSPEQAVAILHATDFTQFQQAMQNPGLMEAMKAAAVLAPPTLQVLSDCESKSY